MGVQESYSAGFRSGNKTKKEIRSLQFDGQLDVPGVWWRDAQGKLSGKLTVERFYDANTGQAFDLHDPSGRYRETPVPSVDRPIVPFGDWKELDVEP